MPNTKTLADGLIKGIPSMLDEIKSKPCITTKKAIDRGKRSKTLSEVKLIENRSKSPQSFLEIRPVQKGALLSHKLQDHGCE